MKKYFGQHNNDGRYIAFYATDVWKEEDIPKDKCIELSFDEWQEALVGSYGVVDGIHTYVPYTIPEEELYRSLRIQRNKLLAESDWTQLIDSPLTSDKKQEWADYRQELRDLPNTVDINNIIYPEKP